MVKEWKDEEQKKKCLLFDINQSLLSYGKPGLVTRIQLF